MMENLAISDFSRVFMRRVLLPKGEAITLRPHTNALAQTASTGPGDPGGLWGSKVTSLLEGCFSSWCALHLGDTISCVLDGKVHKLDVVKLRPGRAVYVNQCTIACDFEISLENEMAELKEKEQERQSRKDVERAHFDVEQRERSIRELWAQRRAKAKLDTPAEPAQSAEAVTIAFQCPGGRITRRFLLSDRVQSLYDFVLGFGDLGEQSMEYKDFEICTVRPPRPFVDKAATLADSGFRASEPSALTVRKG
jgi:hypothetical protein